MIDATLRELIAGGWVTAALRIAFVAVIYLILFLLWRSTVRELHEAAARMPAGDGQAGRAALIVIDGASSNLEPGRILALQPLTTIGRGGEATISIDDPHVSARHAELSFGRGQWWLRDLGSSNGTALNGEPARAVVGIRGGDVIQCGRVRFRFVPSLPVPGEDAPA